MVPELRDLLHDAADSPDGGPVDTDVLLSHATTTCQPAVGAP